MTSQPAAHPNMEHCPIHTEQALLQNPMQKLVACLNMILNKFEISVKIPKLSHAYFNAKKQSPKAPLKYCVVIVQGILLREKNSSFERGGR